MFAQKTLAAPASIQGTGLHLGQEVHLELRAAPVGSGIRFVRTDLPGEPEVEATIDALGSHPRRTALVRGPAEVHTVEHLLATLGALGITNLQVRIDGPELPGLDGSALPYYEIIKTAGVIEQDAPAAEIRVHSPLAVQGEGASIVALARSADGFAVSYILDYTSPVIPSQYLSLEITEEVFAREIAPARTFCLEEEARQLQAAGLGRGANTRNTLVVGSGGVIDNDLRFEDEFVRHKILDLLGDLYLTGCRIQADVLARKSGHALNQMLARELIRAAQDEGVRSSSRRTASRAAEERAEAAGASEGLECNPPYGYRGPLDISMIERILPHRFPFLLVDRVLEVSEDGMHGVGIKNITHNEEFFQGHFPGNPVMPGVLQVEAMAQLAGIVLLSHKQNAGRLAYLLSMDNVKFRRPVVPGDQLVLEAKVKNMKERSALVETRATVDGNLATEALIRFVIVR
ncbi:MAG: UDP-3-O-[3-hydroxymyristoyl] N-acetylglucosamine deacetylase [Planctomycetes bacterium]|nr:UDP-3-O-[3-hydroxymyristoyl] N-acetylglucosamine deacetylase [Planctomycetota bacterium]